MTSLPMGPTVYHSTVTGEGLRPGGALWRGIALCAVAAWAAGCALGPPVYQPPRRASVVLATSPSLPARAGSGPSLTVVDFVDARPRTHREALSSWLREHGGFTGEAVTRDVAFDGPLARRAADHLAQRLAASGRFASVDRARRADRAQGTLVLTARLRRLRGWQGYHVRSGEPPQVLSSLGDVFLDRVEIRPRQGGPPVFLGQSGASLTEADQLDPYALAREGWTRAATALAGRIVEAPLDAPLPREVHLAADARGGLESLAAQLPAGWAAVGDDETAPAGWVGAPACRRLRFEDRSRVHYQPQLGEYHPHLELWACAAGYRGEMRFSGPGGDRFPAEVLGAADDGTTLLQRSLGKSSWPDAAAEVAAFLGLRPLGERVLELP